MDGKETVEKLQSVPDARLPRLPDEALVGLIQNGSEAACAELTKRYMHKSYSIAFQMVGDREGARDLSQDVFVKIYSSIHKFDKSRKFFSWFYRILINHCINYNRRKKALSFIPFTEILSRPGEIPERDVLHNDSNEEIFERRKLVRAAVDRLSPRHKKVIILCDLEGFLQEEAAEILGIAIGTVRSRLHYARQILKQLLKKYRAEM